MTKKVLPLFVLITLAACLLSYKFGSAPVALAKARASAQETSESAMPLTLPTAPATWTVTAYAAGSGAYGPSATRPAGGAGVKHTATCISFSNTSPSGKESDALLYLRDGPSQTGTVVLQWMPGAADGQSVTHSVCGLNVVGSPNTPMTLEFTNSINGNESVNLIGYDAQ